MRVSLPSSLFEVGKTKSKDGTKILGSVEFVCLLTIVISLSPFVNILSCTLHKMILLNIMPNVISLQCFLLNALTGKLPAELAKLVNLTDIYAISLSYHRKCR
ncbi:hypothetical protein BDE02_18G126800 [Populus trichocarpa]|nr:hypothetical protein BDE02_18G126800 [Populus trichocarpa]